MSNQTTSTFANQNEPACCYTEIVADRDLTACQAMAAIAKEFARQRPGAVALWIFGIGFVLGWKLKRR